MIQEYKESLFLGKNNTYSDMIKAQPSYLIELIREVHAIQDEYAMNNLCRYLDKALENHIEESLKIREK